MKMRPTKLLVFGSRKAGTPLMLAAPSSAIDLSLKIPVRENEQGKILVSYNSPEYLKERHGLPQELLQNSTSSKPWRPKRLSNFLEGCALVLDLPDS